MEKTLESLIKKTQKHIEDTIRNFDFDGYFGKKHYKKIRNRLAKEYAESIISSMYDWDDSEEDIENECNLYLDDDPWGGNGWEEGAEDNILERIEDELNELKK